jgi:hypothetical protein
VLSVIGEKLAFPARFIRGCRRSCDSPALPGPHLAPIRGRRPRPGRPGGDEADLPGGTRRQVVAAVLTHHGQICPLRRGDAVASDRGMGHCVTGYLPPGTQPLEQAIMEITHETGLARSDVSPRRLGQARLLPDHRGVPAWRVFPFAFQTASTRTRPNREHDRCCWTRLPLPAHRPSPPRLRQVNCPAGQVFSQPPANAPCRAATVRGRLRSRMTGPSGVRSA